MNQDFKPTNCPKCGNLIWSGISWAGFARRLDTPALSLEQEIIKRINKVMTYECHRTKVSFEAIERSVNRIKWGQAKTAVILAEHDCSTFRLFECSPPTYWEEPVYQEGQF